MSAERVGAGGAIGFQRFHPADQIADNLSGSLIDHLDVVEQLSIAAGVGTGEKGDAGIADPLRPSLVTLSCIGIDSINQILREAQADLALLIGLHLLQMAPFHLAYLAGMSTITPQYRQGSCLGIWPSLVAPFGAEARRLPMQGSRNSHQGSSMDVGLSLVVAVQEVDDVHSPAGVVVLHNV